MNAKFLVFVICAEAIIYLSLYNLQDSTFNEKGKCAQGTTHNKFL